MSDALFTDLGIRPRTTSPRRRVGNPAVQTCRVMTTLEPLATKLAPDVVVVVGDVNSTLAARWSVSWWHTSRRACAAATGPSPEQISPLITRIT